MLILVCYACYVIVSTTDSWVRSADFLFLQGVALLPVHSGPEDTVSPEEDRSILGHPRLC